MRRTEARGLRSRADRLLAHVQNPEAYREVLLESGDAAIALSVWQAPDPWSVVVFVPGTGVHPLFYEEFLDGLLRSGCSVVGVHPKAHGKSPRVRSVLRWDDLVRNAVDATRWAAREVGAPVVLMGSSQGSLVALLAATQDAPVAGVVAHNVFDPADPSTAAVTRFGGMEGAERFVHTALERAARVVPRLPVPITAYLDPTRVFSTPWTQELFELDPLTVRAYPLRFLADLVSVDTRALFDGRLAVPVVVLASRGDPLFPLAGIRSLCDRIVAPSVELVVLDVDCHLVLNEAVDLAVPAAVAAARSLVNEAPSGQP